MVVAITSRTQFTNVDVIAGARGCCMDEKSPPIHLASESWITPVDDLEIIPVAHIKLMRLC
jgi:hypothetical protein